jgi:aspartate/glutamate racemase
MSDKDKNNSNKKGQEKEDMPYMLRCAIALERIAAEMAMLRDYTHTIMEEIANIRKVQPFHIIEPPK